MAETRAAPRVSLGYLPTFERSYLVGELRGIGFTSGGLLLLLLILTILLR